MLQSGVLFENDADAWVFHRLARTSRIPKEGKFFFQGSPVSRRRGRREGAKSQEQNRTTCKLAFTDEKCDGLVDGLQQMDG